MITKKELDEKIEDIQECGQCLDIQIKKFSPITDYEDFNSLDDDFKRCSCGKRPIDVVSLKKQLSDEILRFPYPNSITVA